MPSSIAVCGHIFNQLLISYLSLDMTLSLEL